jgi:cyclic beta-1,2-glucan synthetase
VSAYVQWALGANGTVPAPFVQTAFAADGALHACNAWRPDFDGRVAFLDLGGAQQAGTADRREFLGDLGDEARPAALLGDAPLSGRAGAGLDPCGALQCVVTLAPGEGLELRTLLGDAGSEAEAASLVARYREADIDAVLAEATGLWRDILDTVQVRTPDRAMDIVLNHWLPYQVLACRVWARTAYFQASGAYGFRDQLQDVMALCLSRPDLARAHILRATARQFTEGDVQHWWLPPGGTGVRTRISDDLLWLPYVAMHYIGATGDAGVLDEVVPFVEGEVLAPGEDDRFFRPLVSTQTASVYEHAARTIDRSLALGAHGLPLIGTGDWNDGMNLVGEAGRGESVGLAWLLMSAIDQFAPVAAARGDAARAATWRAHADALARTLDGPSGWDGDWYRRGYYDDGSPLGSAGSEACRIDAIAQSWSVLSGRADPDKARRAMDAVHTHLTRPQDGVAMLFTPPFDAGAADPGYIKGYPPGIRENGGQYTHGSSWSVFACAALGQGARATELFDIFNPILHARSKPDAEHYVVEPYVACADVYSVPPYVGRGGWTWYTGSSGWVWRAGIEAVLGFQRRDGRLEIDPCIRPDWPGFALTHRHRGADGAVTTYDITVDEVAEAFEPGQVPGLRLRDDGGRHAVRVRMGRR